MHLNLSREGMNCLYCHTDRLVKNGKLSGGGQRWKCHGCHQQFSVGGKRGTYDPSYKEAVAHEYCHTSATAQVVMKKHHISSKTLISWAKNHKKSCQQCL